jgi:apolipoprotein N-acyltransferase
LRIVRRILTSICVGALAGIVLTTWFGPRILTWWFTPPAGVMLTNASEAVRWGMDRLVHAQLISLLVGALLGLVAGLACFVPLLSWSGIYVGALPWLALAVSQAAFVALVAAALPAAWRAPGGAAGTVAAVTGLWVLQEALRARLPFGGFPWGRVAFSQADSPFLGWAALGGAPMVSAAVAAAGGCLAVALVRAVGT